MGRFGDGLGFKMPKTFSRVQSLYSYVNLSSESAFAFLYHSAWVPASRPAKRAMVAALVSATWISPRVLSPTLSGPCVVTLLEGQCSRLKPSYGFHFEGLSNFSPSVEGLVQIAGRSQPKYIYFEPVRSWTERLTKYN